jgi:protein phosphatase PTC7
MIPHPDKVAKGGEDAFFVNEKLISVADGVGGWASYGVDPGLYSKSFCRNIKMLFEKDLKKYLLDPKLLISDAHSYTKEIGSTTAVIITL